MENEDLGVEPEDFPDDLTPFITRTTVDHVSGGGFGDVWKCNYNADGISAFVAVKAFRFPEHYDLETINRKISREIGILKILRHNNIVPLWGITTGFGRMPELRCLVSPWMPKGTLNTYLASNQDDLSDLDRSRMLEDVSAGLRYLHSVPVMHGDITGANILIDEGGHARLIDFGLSTIVQPLLGLSHLAVTSIHPGAIRYAAPELVLTDDVRDLGSLEKTDIYSFGCVMLQILSGRHPWSEIKFGRPELRIPVILFEGRGPQRPNGQPAIIDSDWNFIQRCLQFRPELRPSADEVLGFVMHRFCSSGSSGPPDDSSDDVQDGFLGASLQGGSGDSDAIEKPPDVPPLHFGHELETLTTAMHKLATSDNDLSESSTAPGRNVPSTPEGVRRALLVGVAKVDGFPKLPQVHEDVVKMKEFLITRGYLPENIVLMMHHDSLADNLYPSKTNMLREIDLMVQRTSQYDQNFFYYSGHGNQVTSKHNSEPDNQDEAILTYTGKRVIDNVLKKHLVDPLPRGARLFALWDCCHSQTVLDSSRPPDDPLDDPQDGFPGASSYGGSGGSDATEQSPDIPPSHPNHELTTLTTPMHELYTSGNESSNTLELRAHSLEETFQCMWGGPYGLHCNDLIRGHDLQSHLREAHRIHGSDKLRVECKWSYCSKVFNKQSLSRHVEETHMGIVHLCDCGKTFSRRDTLSKHKKRCPG